jgi:hypothetical protein
VRSMGALGGYLQGVEAGSCGGIDRVTVLVSNSLFPTGVANIVEYDFGSGAVIDNVSLMDYGDLAGFDCQMNQVLVANSTGGFMVLNMTYGIPVNVLQGIFSGQTIDEAFVQGSTDTLAVLYSNTGIEQLLLYDPTTGLDYGPFLVPGNSTANLQALYLNGTYYVTLGSADMERVWSISSPTARLPLLSVPERSLTQTGISATSSGLVVWALSNYGNGTRPLLNLTLNILPMALVVPTPSPAPPPAPPGSTPIGFSPGSSWELFVAIIAVAAVIAVAIVVIFGRKKKPVGNADPLPQTGVLGRENTGPSLVDRLGNLFGNQDRKV